MLISVVWKERKFYVKPEQEPEPLLEFLASSQSGTKDISDKNHIPCP